MCKFCPMEILRYIGVYFIERFNHIHFDNIYCYKFDSLASFTPFHSAFY